MSSDLSSDLNGTTRTQDPAAGPILDDADPIMDSPAADKTALDSAALDLVDRWWRAANYVSVGQIYLRSNPLLREPLSAEDTKSRLLGHWGTTPGLNFVYAHLNRAIRRDNQRMLFVAGPGHGGPALVANAWLEGTY
jgi:xylulose-5-phosphate/fructose-6-phosphate phosphoketolase